MDKVESGYTANSRMEDEERQWGVAWSGSFHARQCKVVACGSLDLGLPENRVLQSLMVNHNVAHFFVVIN